MCTRVHSSYGSVHKIPHNLSSFRKKKKTVKNSNLVLTWWQISLNVTCRAVVALIMGKNGEKMDFGYGKTFLEKVSWGGPETPFCGISGPIPACGGVYTEKWTKF